MNKFGEMTYNVEGSTDNSGKLDEQEKAKKIAQEEFEREFLEKKRELQELIDSHKRLFANFAQDNSLQFVLSDGFYFLPETGEINIDTKWFFEEGYNREQIIWACFHELAHFRDMVHNPEAYLANFAYIREQAKNTGKILEAKWREKYEKNDLEFIEQITKQKPIDPKDPSKGSMSLVDESAYKMHHRFFNVMDDIYVNNDVRNRAPRYKKGSEADNEVVKKLYSDKLFVGNDYTEQSRNAQFLNFLLRSEMVYDEDVKISDEIDNIIKQEHLFRGEKWNVRTLIEEKLKPHKNKDTTPGKRYEILKRTLEPIFLALLMKDIEEMKFEKPKKKENGEENGEGGEGGEGEENGEGENITPGDLDEFGDDFPQGSGNPDQFDPEDIEEFLKKAKEQKERKENLTPEERAKEDRKKARRKWDDKYGIEKRERDEFEKIQKKIEPYLDSLLQLWKSITYGRGRSYDVIKTRQHKKGPIHVQDAINEMPNILDASRKGGLDKIRISQRTEFKENIADKPELIRVRVVADLSKSMNAAKRQVLKETITLALLSLRQFNEQLNVSRAKTKTKMRVETEAWVYGSTFKRIKNVHIDQGEELANIIKTVSACDENLGVTRDDLVLGAIDDDISVQDKKKIKQKNIMEIVVVITDGVPWNGKKHMIEETRSEINILDENGVIIRGFQIGDTHKEDRKVFDQVWNDNNKKRRGEIVGTEIKKLPEIFAKTLKKYLGNVKI